MALKVEITLGILLNWNDELTQNRNTFFFFLNADHIKRFEERNGLRVAAAIKKVVELQAKYWQMEKDAEGNNLHPINVGGPGEQQWIPIVGTNPQDYEKEYDALMNIPCTVNF